MKYVVILGDGMAGRPLAQCGGMTTLEAAQTPNMDRLSRLGQLGLAQTVPIGMKPGSDVANLSVLGYDPSVCYTGRSPLEALSLGLAMEPGDVSLRCNLVTLSQEEPYSEKRILDHSAGEISTQDADVLMDAVRQAFDSPQFRFYTGTSYRHITLWDRGQLPQLEPPHDHLGSVIGPYLPEAGPLRDMMEKSYQILNSHPLNLARQAQGKSKANSLWFWGAGTKPSLESFRGRFGKKAAMISAVDLLKGIACGTGMTVIRVPGANGGLHTDYAGKAAAAVDALLTQDHDLVYIHVEAPDEMGHQGSIPDKIAAIEYIDSLVVGPVWQALKQSGEAYRILLLPDHPTPICVRTHTDDPVPFALYDSRSGQGSGLAYTEANAAKTGIRFSQGSALMHYFLSQ